MEKVQLVLRGKSLVNQLNVESCHFQGIVSFFVLGDFDFVAVYLFFFHGFEVIEPTFTTDGPKILAVRRS